NRLLGQNVDAGELLKQGAAAAGSYLYRTLRSDMLACLRHVRRQQNVQIRRRQPAQLNAAPDLVLVAELDAVDLPGLEAVVVARHAAQFQVQGVRERHVGREAAVDAPQIADGGLNRAAQLIAGLFGGHDDGAADGVLAEQRALRPLQHVD